MALNYTWSWQPGQETSNLKEKWNDFDYKITYTMFFKDLNYAKMVPFHQKEMINDFYCLFPQKTIWVITGTSYQFHFELQT